MDDELLLQSEHEAGFLTDHLSDASKHVDAVSAIIVLQLLRDAVSLRDSIAQLRIARNHRETVGHRPTPP